MFKSKNQKLLEIKKHTPSKILSTYIDAYWSIKNISSNDIEIPIVPDGCMDIIYQNKKIFFVGVMSEAILVNTKSDEYTFGIRFKPSILSQILDVKASDFLDKKVELKSVCLQLFKKLNFFEEDEDKKVEKLNSIFEEILKDIKPNKNIIKAIDFIILHNGDVRLNDLEQKLKLSSRHIERLFKNYIGYSPKKFCNIIRFFIIFKRTIKQDLDNFALESYEYGYCDQSHLNKEFKKFSNFSPTHKIMSIFCNTKD